MAVAEYSPPEIIERHETDRDPLHIVMVSESSLNHASGVTTSVMRVAEYLLSQGNRVTIVCPDPAPDSFGDAEVIATESVNMQGFDIGRMSKKQFKELLGSLEPDVLYAASPMRTPKAIGLFLGGYAIDAADELDIPIVAAYQTNGVEYAGYMRAGLLKPEIKRQVRRMHNKADLNLVPSPSSRKDLIKWGVHKQGMRPWGRGVDLERFNRDRLQSEELAAKVALKRSLWTPDGEVLLGVISRLAPEKNLQKLEIVKDIPDARLLLGGDGPERKRLKKLLGSHAILTGRLDGVDLDIAYLAMDAFLFTSQTDTFGQVVQEAMAARLPVVAANRGGPSGIVQHGVTGFLYEPAKKKKKPDTELRYYAEELVINAALRESMGRAGRLAVEACTWNDKGREVEDFCYEAIDLRQARAAKKIGRLALA